MKLNKLFFSFFFLISLNGFQGIHKGENLSPIAFLDAYSNAENALLLDTRPLDEFKLSRIPGAVFAGKKTELYKLLMKERKTKCCFVYCQYGEKRAFEVMKILRSKGFHNVFHLKGGLQRWMKEGLSIDSVLIE